LGRMRRGHSTGIHEAPAEGLHGPRPGLPIARPSRRRRWTATAATAACLVVLAAACSDGDDRQAAADVAGGGDNPTTTGETTTTLSARQQEEQAVREAHEAAIQARIDASAPPTPEPNFAALHETHTGPMLEDWVQDLEALAHNHTAIRYPENSQLRNEIESVTFDDANGQEVAYLEVCTVDDGERVSTVSGEVLAGGVRTVQSTVALRKESGVWKVAEVRENARGEGVVGCAVN
jgi:hypothetical protein